MSNKQKCFMWIGCFVIARTKKEAAEILNHLPLPASFKGEIKPRAIYEVPWENAFQAINKDEHNV